MTSRRDSMRDFRPTDETVRVGGGRVMNIEGYGILRLDLQCEGRNIIVALRGVGYIPQLRLKIFFVGNGAAKRGKLHVSR